MELKYLKNHVALGRGFLLDLIFPKKCIVCSKYDTWCCEECIQKFTSNSHWRCANCHRPSAYGAYCSECRPQYALDGLWVATNYDNNDIAKFIKAYKYKNIKSLLPLLALQIDEFLKKIKTITSPDIDIEWQEILEQIAPLPDIIAKEEKIIVPVPLHPRRLRWRGFNQSLELAKMITHDSSYFILNNYLIRKRYQRPQAKLNKKQRQKNLLDGFVWQGRSLKNKTILLIDDVASTGTTLNECAKSLKKAGAKTVWGIVLAQG